jgi:ketosteroid isomerase-like protein
MTIVFRTRRRGALLALLALSLCWAPLLADDKPKPSATDQVRALEVARGEALMKADTAAIARMTADEFVEISRLGLLRTKADNLRDVASGALKITSFKQDSISVRVYGDVAILREITDNVGTFREFPFAGRLWVTRVFVKRDGRWQAVSMQHTPIP